MNLLLFIAGLGALVLGANLLVRGASQLALTFGISPLVVGLTVVAFGTSAPEMAVSVGAALQGQTDIAVGNVVGSNVFNVLFILGLSALIVPLAVHVQLIRQEVPIMIGASLLLLLLVQDGRVGLFDGALLFGLLLAYTAYLVLQSRAAGPEVQDTLADELPSPHAGAWDAKLPVQIALVVVGLALLVLGADWLVDAAVAFAKAMGVSDLVIGLTIVAAGTSLPEVAASLVAAIRGQRDIAVGNIIGSNIFNILGCIGLAGLASGSAGLGVAAQVVGFDIWVMLAAAMACLPVFLSGREIARWEGALFLGYYAAYVAWLVMYAQHSAALDSYSSIMMSVVAPLTLVTLVVMMVRAPARR